MNRFYCEKEKEILEALRDGALSLKLANHAATCAMCADTVAVSKFLQSDAPAAPSVLDSDFLWWKAQLVRKQSAVERATRSIAVVRKVSYLGAAAAGLWLVFSPFPLGSILGFLSKREIWPAGALTQSALFLGVAALAITLVGSLYLARPEK